MTTTTPLPEPTRQLLQAHLSTPEGIRSLQAQLRATLYTDPTGRISTTQPRQVQQ